MGKYDDIRIFISSVIERKSNKEQNFKIFPTASSKISYFQNVKAYYLQVETLFESNKN